MRDREATFPDPPAPTILVPPVLLATPSDPGELATGLCNLAVAGGLGLEGVEERLDLGGVYEVEVSFEGVEEEGMGLEGVVMRVDLDWVEGEGVGVEGEGVGVEGEGVAMLLGGRGGGFCGGASISV